MVRPKKHLGQHFLTDKNIAGKIAACLSDDFTKVCELGPGTGILTEALLENNFIRQLSLIEIDTESIQHLQAHFSDPRLQIIEADFLKYDLSKLSKSPFALIGNFPYNISSQIFFKVLENKDLIPETVGMIQKEVAERIAAPPGSKTYGILSVLLQTWFDIEYCFTVNEGVFFPPPRVKSAVIRLKRNETDKLTCDELLFVRVVKTAFNQRRKTLRNALKQLTGGNTSHPYLDLRAERLSWQQFEELTGSIEQSENT
ncbi:MAG: 16S rRNA (adenine(1518)-N(6)/adenine(1519)-N(6))-dimethyltransferase [Bacteroidetes bacterium]|nr:MAG: 16S rRNA (adenine(1518)-N(6)/adenine(1519)-N(6))-dimethyltransferase [Bacteroidota bacterium]RLD87343.1 MAG: 16S rRNA (adenine(1518)-N(6)/adenine(1519)-N(6))-dimethyltransferase [Bacteroidota bacterium]HHL57923.1 16S rRNA (adenine(1518)-N(6)/adenine(1519)-N(6))-dimethyltransferase RsmA [Bacteroidota bacterium]